MLKKYQESSENNGKPIRTFESTHTCAINNCAQPLCAIEPTQKGPKGTGKSVGILCQESIKYKGCKSLRPVCRDQSSRPSQQCQAQSTEFWVSSDFAANK